MDYLPPQSKRNVGKYSLHWFFMGNNTVGVGHSFLFTIFRTAQMQCETIANGIVDCNHRQHSKVRQVDGCQCKKPCGQVLPL